MCTYTYCWLGCRRTNRFACIQNALVSDRWGECFRTSMVRLHRGLLVGQQEKVHSYFEIILSRKPSRMLRPISARAALGLSAATKFSKRKTFENTCSSLRVKKSLTNNQKRIGLERVFKSCVIPFHENIQFIYNQHPKSKRMWDMFVFVCSLPSVVTALSSFVGDEWIKK